MRSLAYVSCFRGRPAQCERRCVDASGRRSRRAAERKNEQCTLGQMASVPITPVSVLRGLYESVSPGEQRPTDWGAACLQTGLLARWTRARAARPRRLRKGGARFRAIGAAPNAATRAAGGCESRDVMAKRRFAHQQRRGGASWGSSAPVRIRRIFGSPSARLGCPHSC